MSAVSAVSLLTSALATMTAMSAPALLLLRAQCLVRVRRGGVPSKGRTLEVGQLVCAELPLACASGG